MSNRIPAGVLGGTISKTHVRGAPQRFCGLPRAVNAILIPAQTQVTREAGSWRACTEDPAASRGSTEVNRGS